MTPLIDSLTLLNISKTAEKATKPAAILIVFPIDSAMPPNAPVAFGTSPFNSAILAFRLVCACAISSADAMPEFFIKSKSRLSRAISSSMFWIGWTPSDFNAASNASVFSLALAVSPVTSAILALRFSSATPICSADAIPEVFS